MRWIASACSLFGIAVATVGVLTAAGLVLPASAEPTALVRAVASSPQPAFYTYQAPGGADTAGKRVIALTFDDGPGPYTPQVLSVLERYKVPATFFEIGEQVVEYPQYTRMLAAAGDPVEDHTWTHPDLSSIPLSQFAYQIDQTQNEIRSLTGQTPACVRPPYDDWDSTVLDQIADRGLTTMSYSIDPRDWSLPGTPAIVNAVAGAAFPGAVVDLHDGGGPRDETVAALPQIITDLRAQGYSFVSICSPPLQVTEQSAVFSFGHAPIPGPSITSNAALVGMAATPDSRGYWLVAANGGIFSFGDAGFSGSAGGVHLNEPVVGMAATSDGRGYWLVAADGGIFSFGDAHFYGSTGGLRLNHPVVGMASDPATGGYWLVGADGGIFSFHAFFYGSQGAQIGPNRFVAICATFGGNGYLLAGQHPANGPVG